MAHACVVERNDQAPATNGHDRSVPQSDRVAADEREQAAVERERAADERERAEDRRDRVANERDRIANERQAIADRRERIADEREELADQREDAADKRERQQDELDEPQADRSSAPKAVSTEGRGRRALEAYERVRARQIANAARIERNRALVERTVADNDRRRAAIAQEISEAGRRAPTSPPQSGQTYHPLASKLQDLRRQLVKGALMTAEVEDKIARQQDRLASRRTTRTAEYQQAAQDAREGSKRAREIAERYSD